MRYSKSAFSLHSLWAKRLSAFIMCGSCRSCDRVLGAEPLQHRVLPELLLRRPELDGHVGDLLGVVPHGPVELGEGRPGVQRVGLLRRRPPASGPPGTSARSGPRRRRPRPCCARCACPARPASRSRVLAFAHRVPPPGPRPACGAVLAPILQARPEHAGLPRKRAMPDRRPASSPLALGLAARRAAAPPEAAVVPGLGGGPRRAAAAPRRDRRSSTPRSPAPIPTPSGWRRTPPTSPPAPRRCAPAPPRSPAPVVDPAAPPARSTAGRPCSGTNRHGLALYPQSRPHSASGRPRENANHEQHHLSRRTHRRRAGRPVARRPRLSRRERHP